MFKSNSIKIEIDHTYNSNLLSNNIIKECFSDKLIKIINEHNIDVIFLKETVNKLREYMIKFININILEFGSKNTLQLFNKLINKLINEPYTNSMLHIFMKKHNINSREDFDIQITKINYDDCIEFIIKLIDHSIHIINDLEKTRIKNKLIFLKNKNNLIAF